MKKYITSTMFLSKLAGGLLLCTSMAYAQNTSKILSPLKSVETPALSGEATPTNAFSGRGSAKGGSDSSLIPSMADQSKVNGKAVVTTTTPSLPNPVAKVNKARKADRIGGSADTLYTWTDSKGITHVTNTPPPDIVLDRQKFDPTKIKVDRSSISTQRPLSATERLAEFDKKKAEKEKKDKTEGRNKAQRALQCEQLRAKRSLYKSDQTINVSSGNGDYKQVDDSSRSKTLQVINDSYSSLCQ